MRRGIGICIPAGLLITLFILFYPFYTALTVTAVKKGQVILCARMAEGEEFMLSFIHSFNKRPVHDTLQVAGNHLIIVQSRYDTFGAGMPESSTESGRIETDREGWVIWKINRSVPEIALFVGSIADHTLTLKGKRIPLLSYVESGTSLLFKLGKVSLYNLWKGKCLR
ncbi:MAG: DUF1850 domain-containing protein [Deltaproteobacteria bacterium]|nr:MAG: DUF1850 domain-containing protein [Deltaproteobacteria bacterium]